jgi:hypothetical protein
MKATLVVFLAAALVVALVVEPPHEANRESEFRPLLLRPAFAKTISKPFMPLLVEVLWLRALNAIGQKDNEQKNKALYEYGVVLSELDPRFFHVYEFIGLALPYAVARDTWVGADYSSDMFRRGLKAFPTSMKLHLYLGFSLFHRERKFSEAADVFAAAAKLPDALDFMAPLATRLKTHSGKAEDALEMTAELLQHTSDENMRKVLERRLDEIRVEIVLQNVDAASTEFRTQEGRWPSSVDELRSRGFYSGERFDPLGSTIEIDAQGKANSGSLNRRLEIYE